MVFFYEEKDRGSIGATLRIQREAKNIDLEKIAGELKINAKYLTAIEENRFDALPSRVHGRMFIKSYSQALGLDPEKLIQMYDKTEKDSEDKIKKPEEESQISTKSRIDIVPVILGFFLGIVILFVFIRYAKIPETELSSFGIQKSNVLTVPVHPGAEAGSSKELILRIEGKEPGTQAQVIADEDTLFSGRINPGVAMEFRASERVILSLETREGVDCFINGAAIALLTPKTIFNLKLSLDNNKNYIDTNQSQNR